MISSHRHARKSAFTLIELLVVISIIALMIAILLPALRQARAVARLSACGSHLRSIGIGLQVYINDWEVYPSQLNYSYYSPYSFATHGRYFYNLGQLYKTGIITPAETFYCPAAEGSAPHLNSPGNPWVDNAGTGTTTRSSYFYFLRSPTTALGDHTLSSYVTRRPEEIKDSSLSILSDNVYQVDWLHHADPATFNVLRVDGSVKAIHDQENIWFNAVVGRSHISRNDILRVFDYFDTF